MRRYLIYTYNEDNNRNASYQNNYHFNNTSNLNLSSTTQISITTPTETEIKIALDKIAALKTLGDSLHVAFYQKNWTVIKNKLITSIQNIFINECIPNSWCRTRLCLIPKNEIAHKTNHYSL